MTVRLIWDFFGPDARGTAIHHLMHLKEILAKEQVQSAESGIGSANPNHAMSWCQLEMDVEEAVARALRPNRRITDADYDKIVWG